MFDTADGPRALESSDYKYWNKQPESSRLLESLDVGTGTGVHAQESESNIQ